MSKAIPEGYHSVQAYIIVDGAARAIVFYKKAFGATVRLCMKMPDGRVGHAEIQIGDSVVMMADESAPSDAFAPGHFGGSPVALMIYTDDCDAMYKRAISLGSTVPTCTAEMPGTWSGVASCSFMRIILPVAESPPVPG